MLVISISYIKYSINLFWTEGALWQKIDTLVLLREFIVLILVLNQDFLAEWPNEPV